jgi:hypothetical protein
MEVKALDDYSMGNIKQRRNERSWREKHGLTKSRKTFAKNPERSGKGRDDKNQREETDNKRRH